MLIECKKHGLTDHFERNDYGFRCRKCNSEAAVESRRKKKKWCVEYLGGECIRCGYKKCMAALEFHHRNPEEKEFQFSRYQNYNYKKLAEELDKCDLLCSNCHKEIHFELCSK